jgi:SAM-dependent methyltransferase
MIAAVTATRIDPLRSCPTGYYADEFVIIEPGGASGITATPRSDGRIAVTHRLRPAELDDELSAALAATLAPLTDDHEVFARAFTGIVLTSRPQASAAWELFYRNSLARIRHRTAPGYSAVYRHALELLPTTSVVDLGCSFGFLALHLAGRGVEVTAADTDPGTTALVRAAARRLRRPLAVVTTGPDAVPLPSRSADAVALLHVLEHVDAATGRALLAEAGRIARHRVVVAVPYEPEPTALFGHVRRFCPAELHELGRASGWRYEVHEHHGGWLVLERNLVPSRSPRPGDRRTEGEPS